MNSPVRIFIATHKDFTAKLPDIYTPILVGSNVNSAAQAMLRDNSGEQIADRNPSFCELTALYWIWKNDSAAITGLVHYRRFFSGLSSGRGGLTPNLLSEKEVHKFLDNFDIIIANPSVHDSKTVYEQYRDAHHIQDLEKCRNVIAQQCPDYLSDFDAVMASYSFSGFNMFVAKKPLVDNYCSWLFPILFELEELCDISSYDSYQSRIYGFIAERLFNVWLQKNQLRCLNSRVHRIDKKRSPLSIKRRLQLWRRYYSK
ncbi:DUF4422 domain-containing protein [Zhongshania guokunii]|uniref:DUF4422 domain-containing protein n=1 Tax=Zhongshania guokunii TaxID=641783 RepID=A0ABV3U903_9GAMM